MNKKTPETHIFQTEVQQLLQLMIHSLYSNKEVFLRELISNASDACDKLGFASLTDSKLIEDDEALGIWIDLDEKENTIIIRDNGIGMTHDEVIENIGTIARSGTRHFLEQMNKDQSNKSNFIGQFGVGFYSCFLVSKDVTLRTRKAGIPNREGVKWVSNGSGKYTMETIDKSIRGTEITLKLNKEDREYADKSRVKNIISKYSDHILLPIQMLKDQKVDKDGKKKTGQNSEWELVNKGSALWARPKAEVSEEEHNTFYTSLTYDPNPPAVVLHNRVEGNMEYISLFYIPSNAPYDLWDREQRHGIKLYVRRIFISDDAKQLMPNYLRFVRGLVDSADLPLNVSREFLQQNREIDKIRAASVKKILAELKKISIKDQEKYIALWKEYGRVLKEGLVEDIENKEILSNLVRFSSTYTDDEVQNVSLEEYVKRMPMKQKVIYYVTAENHTAAKSSPQLEIFRKNGIEVLLLSDPVDEWVVSHLMEYQDRKLQSISKGDLDIDGLKDNLKEEDSKEKQQESMKPLMEKIRSVLGDKVKEVRISSRLVDSPSCLVADQFDMGGNMERILQAIGQDAPSARPILEINPDHQIVKQIDLENELADDWAQLLFDQAALAEGALLKDPAGFVKCINKLLVH